MGLYDHLILEGHEDRVSIGKNVRIQPNTTLGALPLIFNRETGERVRPEMKGGLIIEDNVDIGAGCVLNIGEERDTLIKKNSMIGHLSSVGHDAIVGENAGVSAHVCVCGFAEVGEWVYIAPQSVIQPYRKIGDYTMVGTMSNITKDIPEGVIAYGNPCRAVRENKWRPKLASTVDELIENAEKEGLHV